MDIETTCRDEDAVYAGIPVFDRFESLMDPSLYRPLPDDWVIGQADVVESTKAIARGRYKSVNTAGAAVIAAVANALGNRDFPFVFGGDGASFVVAEKDADLARRALAATAAWVRDDLGLALRVALVPVGAARRQNLDVRVARFAPSPDLSYAMFSGGGLAWAGAEMKRGAFAIEPGPPGTRPDLTGLSCRWKEIPASRGVILSLIVTPTAADHLEAFRALVEDVIRLASETPDAGRPVPDAGPALGWSPAGIDLEARALTASAQPLRLRRLQVAARALAALAVFKLGRKVGRFVPATYLRELVSNSDFRKYDDRLLMTLDCTPALADRIEATLAAAETAGTARSGVHRQAAALMTCIVPSLHRRDHVHFVDGAAGGYASAAAALKPPTSPS